MLEMEYGATVSHKPILLANGFYKGIEYFILNIGSHPTAYVKIPHGNKYWGSNGDEILTHCGITYTSTVLYLGDGEYSIGWILGWDYAHSGDFYYSPLFPEPYGWDHVWCTREIFEDVKFVINQVVG